MVLILAALLLGAGCASRRPAPNPPGFSVLQSWACPLPAHRGLLRVAADGKASMSIFDGLDGPPPGRMDRSAKQLSPEDMDDLRLALSKSGYRDFPERADSYPPRYTQTDACSRSLEIEEGGETKRISFRDGDVPEALQSLLNAIDAVLDRKEWAPEAYPWGGGGGPSENP